MNNLYDNEDFFNAYAQMPRSKEGLRAAGEWHQLQPLIPDVTGRAVLDLGCGYGWHCRYAAEHGARYVLGLDISHKMIETARAQDTAPCIEYRVCGLDEYDYPAGQYDLVISNLVLHYVKDLEAVYQKVYQTLKPGGIFLFNIEHPVFTAGVRQDWVYDKEGKPLYWPVDQYYYPGTRSVQFLEHTVSKEHHTLTQILMGLIHAGFTLQVIEEAMPDPSMLHLPGMADEMRRPMMLLVSARKE